MARLHGHRHGERPQGSLPQAAWVGSMCGVPPRRAAMCHRAIRMRGRHGCRPDLCHAHRARRCFARDGNAALRGTRRAVTAWQCAGIGLFRPGFRLVGQSPVRRERRVIGRKRRHLGRFVVGLRCGRQRCIRRRLVAGIGRWCGRRRDRGLCRAVGGFALEKRRERCALARVPVGRRPYLGLRRPVDAGRPRCSIVNFWHANLRSLGLVADNPDSVTASLPVKRQAVKNPFNWR